MIDVESFDECVEVSRVIEEAILDIRFPDCLKPMKSGAMQRATGATCGMMLRQMNDEVGLPCRKSATARPLAPTSL